jgi:hypothetical protein
MDSMPTAVEIADIIEKAAILWITLDNLDTSNRPINVLSVVAAKLYLTQLTLELQALYHSEAIREINLVIGNGDTQFQVFIGLDGNNQPLEVSRLRAIYNTVVGLAGDPQHPGCNNQNLYTELACLVAATLSYAEIDGAVKERIIIEVNNIVDFTYNPRGDTALNTLLDNSTSADLYNGSGNLSDTTKGLPFKYNRVATANFAISNSRDNFENMFPYGNGNLVSAVQGTVGGTFTYPTTTLDHVNNTGSAIFVSEAIHAGEIPMSHSVENGEVNTNDCNQGAGSNTSGWRSCPNNSIGATSTWKFHLDLVNYFSAYGALQVGSLSSVDLRDANLIDFNNSNVLNANGLYSFFDSTGMFASLNTGDLIYVDLGTNDPCGNGLHSFLIVGWGSAVHGYEAVNAEVAPGNQAQRVDISYIHNQSMVPYIADFDFGYNGDLGKTGWLQDPRPRPFYTTVLQIGDANNSPFTQDVVGFMHQDYANRMRGAFRPFLYQNCSDCSLGCFPTWRFYKLSDYIKLPFVRISG